MKRPKKQTPATSSSHLLSLNRLESAGEQNASSMTPWSQQRLVLLVQALQLASEWPGTNYLLPLNALQRSMKLHMDCAKPTHMQYRLSDVWKFFDRVWNYIPSSMLAGLVQGKDVNSVNQLSFTVVATSAKTLDLIFKTPTVWIIKQFTQNLTSYLILKWVSNKCELFCLQRTVYKLALPLPIALPLHEIKGLTPFDGLADKIHYVFAKAGAGNRLHYY